ncbi:DUF167 domain-containing protein [Patescibacteria group bacterium]|nr:DUF167 domain-containing protein [Patescibacteria group bacterium]
MRFEVKVITNARMTEVVEKKDTWLKVKVRSKAHKQKANLELIDCLADYFGINKSQIKIYRGQKNSRKVIDIEGIL